MYDMFFYKRQYAYLLGKMDIAIDQLAAGKYDDAKATLMCAEITVEERWLAQEQYTDKF